MSCMQIKNWLTGSVIYEGEADSLKDLVGSAIKSNSNLSSADLRFADLSFADLRSADLRFADLRSANLSSADLRSADLSFADLRSADLRFADLRFADLRFADLSFANLGSQHIFSFSGVGSARRSTNYWVEANEITCGCFRGTLKDFVEKIKETHANNPKHLSQYKAGVSFFRACVKAIPKNELALGKKEYASMVKKSEASK
jgi:hypothetical protein